MLILLLNDSGIALNVFVRDIVGMFSIGLTETPDCCVRVYYLQSSMTYASNRLLQSLLGFYTYWALIVLGLPSTLISVLISG